jgi:hypothetical protein
MTSDDPTLGQDDVELQDGTSVTLEAGALWVTVDEDLRIESAMRVRDLRGDAVSMDAIHESDESPFDYPLDAFREDAASGDLFPLGSFLDNRSERRAESTAAGSIPDMVMDVWGGYTEFQEYGPEYVSYLIEGDIREIRGEMQNQEEIDKEFADIAINAVRALEEFGSDGARELIQWRLEERMAGDQEDIIERYTTMWTGHLSDPTEFKR